MKTKMEVILDLLDEFEKQASYWGSINKISRERIHEITEVMRKLKEDLNYENGIFKG